ncbi:MAG: hypothetical protein WEB60_04655 [Terrimicrobiaceae bacterium]
MTSEEKMKRWVDTWKVAGPELERIKQEELRAMDETRSAEIFNLLAGGWVDNWRPPERETDHGLVIQQHHFSKAHADQRRP